MNHNAPPGSARADPAPPQGGGSVLCPPLAGGRRAQASGGGNTRTIILGLTGSIGMGKSTVARQFERLGVPVFSSDEAVHRLLGHKGKAVSIIARAFAGTEKNHAIDRAKLAQKVFGKPAKLALLESILHPFVVRMQRDFVLTHMRRRARIVLLDIPLLYETGAEARVDGVIVVTAPTRIQRQRVLRRKGMTPEKLTAILARQLPNDEKCRRADWVIPTGLGYRYSLRCVKKILHTLRPH
jgi:dephospho-CoA kinase